MNLLELATERYSVRGYEDRPVQNEDLQYILECARMAPSAVNKQPLRFLVCQSEEALAKARQCYDREWFTTAPMVVICVIEHNEEWVRGDNHPHGIVDVSIAAEHICLAATERGLGSCWVCNFDAKLCHELFNLSESQEAAVFIPLGYATTEPSVKKRKEMAEIVTIL